jgi:hypothetical protein
MDPILDAEDVLKTIETAVIYLARQHSEMNNYPVLRAYEAAVAHYHDVSRQRTPKEVSLTALDALTYNAVHEACEERLGKPVSREPGSSLLTLEDLVTCLRMLRKSVDFWTKHGGRTGYLDHVSAFIV